MSLFQREAIESIDGITRQYHPTLRIGIDEDSFDRFSIFPTPAEKKIVITGQGDYDSFLTIEWLDIHGRMIRQTKAPISGSAFRVEESVPSVRSGLYLIRINGQSLHKMVVQ
ncbi:MAG: T9SS type A sorting domain-containing protein [Bacteroidota bacterium]